MRSVSLTRFVAVVLGALMVGNTLSNVSSKVYSLDEITTTHILGFLVFPLMFNMIIAWLVFSYAKKVELQLQETDEHKFLYAGLKLLGFYLLAVGIPSFISSLSFLTVNLEVGYSRMLFIETFVSSIGQILIGYALLWHTPKLIQIGNPDPDV